MRFGFVLSEVGYGLRRNLSMVVSVILVTFVSLTFVGAAALLQMQITQMKGYWYDKVQVAIFLCGEDYGQTTCADGSITDPQRTDIQAMLESAAVKPYVADFEYESKAQALIHFQPGAAVGDHDGSQCAEFAAGGGGGMPSRPTVSSPC